MRRLLNRSRERIFPVLFERGFSLLMSIHPGTNERILLSFNRVCVFDGLEPALMAGSGLLWSEQKDVYRRELNPRVLRWSVFRGHHIE